MTVTVLLKHPSIIIEQDLTRILTSDVPYKDMISHENWIPATWWVMDTCEIMKKPLSQMLLNYVKHYGWHAHFHTNHHSNCWSSVGVKRSEITIQMHHTGSSQLSTGSGNNGGSKFVAMRISVELVEALSYKLRIVWNTNRRVNQCLLWPRGSYQEYFLPRIYG